MQDIELALHPFVQAEQQFGELQKGGDYDAAVASLEQCLKENQQQVQMITTTVLSSLFEKLAIGYNTLGMKYVFYVSFLHG